MERTRKRGTAAQAQIRLRARQECLLRWQRLLATALEYVYSLRWATKQLTTALEKFRAEMMRWPAAPMLQAGFDAELSRTTCTVAMLIPKETIRPTWPKARRDCKHRNDEGRAATKEYKAAGSTWRRCEQCGSRWKLVPDERGLTAWEEVPPVPYPGAAAPSAAKAKHSWSRSALSQGSSEAFQPKPRSPRRSRVSSRPRPEVHSMTAGSESSSMEVPVPKLTENRRASLPVPEVSDEDAKMTLAQPTVDGGSDWETTESLALAK